MRWRRVWVPICLAVCFVGAGCSSAGVELTRSDQLDTAPDTTTPDTTTPATTTTTTTPAPTATTADTTTGGDGLPAIEPVAWGPCVDQPDPWQCGIITVPMDYARPEARQITIALNRLPAADDSLRIGSLVLNPGGPGGSGLAIAYGEAESFPTDVLDRFDIVGFDPRGVGRSTAVECPDDFDAAADSFQACIDLTGELLSYLGTPNVARDLDMIRRAVQDQQLTYLGYSYGTALGAVYADMFPHRVRALVLDGAIDPDAGLSNVDGGGGYDFYAEQDFEATVEVFHTLCDATSVCSAGPNSRELVDRVYDNVRETPAPFFANGETLTRADVDDILYTSMYSAYNWATLGIALKDADDGDASTLAAMYSWLQFGYPAEMEAEANYEFANFAIRCADFENRGASSDCEDFPDTAEPLPVITAIDASTPIVVVGTKDDPATPGRYAAQLAGALGDAVDISWDGAGHTAFLTSGCITDIVTVYLVDQTVPPDGQTCPFVPSASTLGERADVVFQDIERDAAIGAILPLLVDRGISARLFQCVAEGVVGRGDERLIVHQLLGVESPDLIHLRGLVSTRCQLHN